MKTQWIKIACLSLALVACKKNEESASASADSVGSYTTEEKSAPLANSNVESSISSSAAVVDPKSNRKFVRTADLKFRVKNVTKVTYQIEDIVNRMNGFVTNTQLSSSIDYTNSQQISADSTLESTFYTVNNSMTIRVPNVKLDTTLKQIAKLIDYLDYRNISADDVSLQILSNNLTQKRTAQQEERMRKAIDERGKKLNETMNAEENVYDHQQRADEALIQNLSLKDQIQYSTINLSLYQKQDVMREFVANPKNIAAYEPSFAFKLWDSVSYGFEMLEAFILLLVKIWWIIIIGVLVYVFIKRHRNKE